LANKRIKITFETVTNGEYTIVDKIKVEEANQQVKAAMKDVVRVYEKKETKSQQQAALLVLNA
jgi:hypothetical protein